SYVKQREIHEQSAKEQLAAIWGPGRGTAKALAAEIKRAGPPVLIHPYLFWDWLGMNAPEGSLRSGNGEKPGGRLVHFTAYMWNREGQSGTSGYTGPGSEADAMLFHELVHASRARNTPMSMEPVTQGGYDNEEEYVATVLTNVYLSEKTKGK